MTGQQTVATAADTLSPTNRYRVVAPIGHGGMAEVLLVEDDVLHRQVAMKVLRSGAGIGEQGQVLFLAEAQATSQLEHPGIPPVYDVGRLPDGRPYFTMKLVRGRTLRDVLLDLLLHRTDAVKEYTLHRLVTIVERIAEALHFAHERSVIHRDVKPENVMIGEHGEVHLMDWGIARIDARRLPTPESAGALEVATARTDHGFATECGVLKGTLPYMSPEQVLGESEAVDRRTDVFSLGCVLYEVLTLHPPFDPSAADLASKVAVASVPPLETRNPRRPVVPELAAVCRRAMEARRSDRYATAWEFAQALRRWLDGSSDRMRREREAGRLTVEGKAATETWEATLHALAEAERALEGALARTRPWDPVEAKRPLHEARRRVADLRTRATLDFAEACRLLEGALLESPDHAEARAALAGLWATRLDRAEAEGDAVQSAYALELVRRYDTGSLRSYVQGDGTLSLTSSPSGADVRVSRLLERDGRLVASDESELGTTPLERIALPMGSYVCRLRSPGLSDVTYPVFITRQRAWRGTARMRTAHEIGLGFVFVPGGSFLAGEGRSLRWVDVPDFAVARFPVTLAEYAEFLAALEREGGAAEAERRLPRTQSEGPYIVRGEGGSYRPSDALVEGDARVRCEREYGQDFWLRIPVVGVSFDDAVTYCAWRSRMDGATWRLPTEYEREKAARGVDGRRFPWGDLQDGTLAKCRESRQERAQPEPVGAYPTAVSVYGMGDAAGGVWEWTDSWLDEIRALRVVRGGSWSSTVEALRSAYRHGLEPTVRQSSVGFRCARSLGF